MAGLNVTGFGAADLDKAIEAGRSPQAGTDCAEAARVQRYETVNRVLNAQQPYLFAFVPDALLAGPPALRGVRPGPFSLYADVHRWWVQK